MLIFIIRIDFENKNISKEKIDSIYLFNRNRFKLQALNFLAIFRAHTGRMLPFGIWRKEMRWYFIEGKHK